MRVIRLMYLSNASGITFIAIVVWEIQKSQDDATVLSKNWNRICYVLFLTKSSTKFGKLFYKKVAGNFISFQRYKMELHWNYKTRVVAVLPHC
jgi:hypothetical protein